MTAGRFMANFGYIANAPGGVGKLRDLIYHFAFAGELVEHSSESAAGLAEALAQTESPTGRTRRAMLEPAAGFYPIPAHWLWVNIRDVGHDWGQIKPSEDFTYIDVSAIDNHRGVVADGASVVSAVNAPSRARKVVKKGTVIYSTVRPYLLNIAVIERDFVPDPIASTAFAVLHPHDGVEAQFVYYFLRSPAFVAYVEGVQSGMAYPAISDQKFFAASFPLAPTEEQKRILAKVDELMALCNQLEAQQQEQERRFPVLSRTCHSRFVEAPTPANLSRIFDEIGSVDPADLRRTILTLAVQAKLVPQDTREESATKLLERVEVKREQLLTKGYPNPDEAKSQLRKQREQRLPEGLQDLPVGWKWATLMQTSLLIADCHNKTAPYISSGIRLIRTTNIRNGQLNLLEPKYVSEATYERWSARCKPEPGDILITREAPMGEVCIIPEGVKLCLGQRMMLIRLVPDTVDANFLLYSLMDPELMQRVQDKPIGATVQHLRVGGVETLLVAVPPLAEQRRIVAKVDELMALVNQLEAQQQERDKLAEDFAKACVASFTGTTQLERPEKMKAPKTELVSLVTLGTPPQPDAKAPLAHLLSQHEGTLPAKSLWQQSGLTIDDFYQHLKTEIAQGWIAPPAEAEMKVLEEA